jgi:hypothetical protein
MAGLGFLSSTPFVFAQTTVPQYVLPHGEILIFESPFSVSHTPVIRPLSAAAAPAKRSEQAAPANKATRIRTSC